jgi:glycosyltransferase involved in cell wall biosynthesis
MEPYTLGLFANMYPAYDGDYRGIFIRQMVTDLEARGISVKKAVKTSPSVTGYIPFFWQSLILARDASPDIFQAEYIPHSSLIPAFLKRKGIPLVLKFHGDDARIFPFKNPLNRAIITQMIRHADHIVSSSEEIRRILMGFGTDPDRITAVHTGVDSVFFSPGSRSEAREQLHLPDSGTIFIFVGRLHPWKGVPEILRVAEACPEIRFVLIGPGSVPPHPGNCTFTGPLVPEMVRIWLRAADCMVLPTHTEAVPTSVMEAFASGIPAVTTDIGGCPEIVEERKNGLMVPVNDIRKLKEAVEWMHLHIQERSEMGQRARTTVTEKYDHTVQIEKLIAIHRELLSSGARLP